MDFNYQLAPPSKALYSIFHRLIERAEKRKKLPVAFFEIVVL